MTAMGVCPSDRAYISTKQEIHEEKGSKARVSMQNLLDEVCEYVSDRPECIRFIEAEEKRKKNSLDPPSSGGTSKKKRDKSLGKPESGTKERWGGYGKAAKWLAPRTGRIELIIRYACYNEDRREVDGYENYEDLDPFQRIECVADAGVRAMLHELNNPEKRIKLIIFEWYYEETLDPFLRYTQNVREFQITRAHRLIRMRLKLMASLKGTWDDDTGKWEPDAADGSWKTKLEPLINEFMTEHHDWVFDQVNPRSIARTFFEETHDDFYMRTRGYFSPLCLPWGVLDEKGDAVRTAQELVELAGPQGPMISFPQLIAFDPSNAQRKGSLHEGIDARAVVEEITHPRCRSVALTFLPDLWKHYVAFSKMPPSTILRDVPELRPLYDFLHPMARHQPISNGGNRGAEALMNKIKRVAKPQQRMNDPTITQNVAAVCREPDKLYRFTEAQDLQASITLGHSKATRVKEKPEAPDVPMADVGLGFSAGGGEGETWGAYGSFNEETYVMGPKKAKKAARSARVAGNDDDDSSDEESSDDDGSNTSAKRESVVVGVQDGPTILSKLQVGQLVRALYGPKYPGWWYAEVHALPSRDAMGEGSQSVTLRWLDEIGGEGSGIYGYDANFDSPQPRAASKIVDTNPAMHDVTEAGGPKRWLTPKAFAAAAATAATAQVTTTLASAGADSSASASIAASTAATSQASASAYRAASGTVSASTSAADVDVVTARAASIDGLAQLILKRRHKAIADERMKQRVHVEMAERMDVGVRVNSALANSLGVSNDGASEEDPVTSEDDPIDADMMQLRNAGSARKQRLVSSSALLSSNPSEYLNDCHVGAADALMEQPSSRTVRFMYPRGRRPERTVGSSLGCFETQAVQRALEGEADRELKVPINALVQSFVSHTHWHKLIVSFEERVVYYSEPYGGALSSWDFGKHIEHAFAGTLGTLDGWRLKSIEVKLQTDGCNCGVWSLVVDRAFLAYCDSVKFGSGDFGAFLVSWLGRMGRGVVDLNQLRGSGIGRREAVERNEAYIREQRQELREQLIAAAHEGLHPFPDGAVHGEFVESGTGATEADLDALDAD